MSMQALLLTLCIMFIKYIFPRIISFSLFFKFMLILFEMDMKKEKYQSKFSKYLQNLGQYYSIAQKNLDCVKIIRHNMLDLNYPSSSQRINNNMQKNNYNFVRTCDSVEQYDNIIILPIKFITS